MIDPKTIKLGKPKVTEPIVALDKYRAYKKLHSPDAKLKLPSENFYSQDFKKLLETELSACLKEFKTFIDNPGKFKLPTADGYYVMTSTNIYFISNTGKEQPVSPTRLLGLFLVACDKGVDCFFEPL
jgi:hypothetical protein